MAVPFGSRLTDDISVYSLMRACPIGACRAADVPVIDIGPFKEGDPKARQAVAAEVGRAIQDIGFLVITGYGVNRAGGGSAARFQRLF